MAKNINKKGKNMNNKSKTKDYTSFNFRIENLTLKKLEEIAKKEDRTIASLVRIAINDLIEKYKKILDN